MDELWQGLQKEAGHLSFWKSECNWEIVKNTASPHEGRLLPADSTNNITPAQHSMNEKLLADGCAVSRKLCTLKNVKDSFMACSHMGTKKRKKACEIVPMVRPLPCKYEGLALSSESTLQISGVMLCAYNHTLGA